MILASVLFVAASALGAQAQEAPAKPRLTPEMLEMWERIEKMVVDMAEQFPAEKYDYKPTPEVRSFKEQLLHVASSNYFFIRLSGGAKTKAGHAGRETKADVVAVLKESFRDGAATIQDLGDSGLARMVKHPFEEHNVSLHRIWTMAAAHDGEHYGQLVIYYRLNGLVPPETAKQQAAQQY
jgi:uncharacterized damage-inducible protein DinB